MCRISEEIQQKAMAKNVKAAMKNFHISFEQACDGLEIPKEDRPVIEKLIRSM